MPTVQPSFRIMKSCTAIPAMSWQQPIVVSLKCKLTFVVKDGETKELFDLKSTSDVFKNDFSEAIQNSKDKIALAKSNLKKKNRSAR